MATALPGDIYGKYKRATAFFVDWVLRARSPPNASAVPDAAPLPLALAACQVAITLRERVARSFALDETASAHSNQTHAYFLNRLKTWHASLKTLQSKTKGETTDEQFTIQFTNYYEVLEMAQDFFPEVDVIEVDASRTSSPSDAERKRLFDEAFAQDLTMEIACFFLELEELSDAVYSVYCDVKEHKKSLVEASVVTKVAIQCASSAIARFQLRYPSVKNAADMMTVMQDHIPMSMIESLFRKIMKQWRDRGTAKRRLDAVPGGVLVDFLWVARALLSFEKVIPADPRMKLVAREGFFGATYSEERSSHYLMPDPTAMPSFLCQQLPLFGAFVKSYDQFFISRQVSIPLVFTTMCWIKSVSALQGNGGLVRNVSLSISHRWTLLERLEESIDHGEVRRADPKLHKEMEDLLDKIKQLEKANVLLRANPVLAGFMELDNHLQYLHLGAESLLVTSRFRAFFHLAAAKHGSFMRTYLLSSHMTVAAVDSFFRNKQLSDSAQASKVREHYHIRDLSKVFCLVIENDLSILLQGPSSQPASLKTLLSSAADLARQELFESRLLSRDMLEGIPGKSRQYVVNRSLEDVIMLPLMPLLDCLELDGSIRDSDEGLLQLASVRSMNLHGDMVAAYCRRAANVISRRFIDSQRASPWMETAYFVFANTPNWAKLEFGDVDYEAYQADTHVAFNQLLSMMEESAGPLSPDQLKELRTKIKADPGILALSCDDIPVPNMHMLLHHAAAGSVRDKRLVEWMMQVGAMFFQPVHWPLVTASDIARQEQPSSLFS
ncbi:hypothetical protein Poli38472_010194 [Pythium oligandrum]|uniref:DUF6604 domain-containing protein n=1 Tax=Pythium oligandrum TaxID=41045 RepID=A0A8K1FCS2_PYTOL|nr:hypothetical protein Poli38472_010194 [Pythium oligandrum]|eukprot:TMW58635.1 hypothetical protein Poli38472_010194 [Pythium oligandrum]